MLVDRFLTPEVRAQLQDRRTTLGFGLDDVIASGVANPDSSIGAYAPDADSYDVFAPLLHPIIVAHHHLDDLPASSAEPRPDLVGEVSHQLGDVVSTRVRVARNLAGFAFPAGIGADARLEVERVLSEAFATFPDDLAGEYFQLGSMTASRRQELVADHLLFKSGDRFLKAAGIDRDWPDGRGIFLSDDRQLVAWVNEEDHLRLISMQPGGDLGAVARRLGRAHAHLRSRLEFARDHRLGWLASCPSNLGIGMRASVHVRIPDPGPGFADRCRALGMQVRGVHGEHSESAGGIHDLSNAHRLGVTVAEVLQTLATGVASVV
jgi:protein-arginine kinase